MSSKWFLVRTHAYLFTRKEANSTMDRDNGTCSAKISKPNTVWEVVLTKSFQIGIVQVVFPGQLELNAEVKIKDGNKPEKTCGKYKGRTDINRRTIVFPCDGLKGDKVRIIQHETAIQLCEVSLCTQPDHEYCLRPDSPFMATGRKIVSHNRTIYSLSCLENYELVGNSEVECHGGTWAVSSAICKQKLYCHSLPNVSNGFLKFNTTSVNSTAYLECHEGYRSVGPDTIHCLPTRKWSANILTCEAIKCDETPRIRNGKGNLLSNSAFWGSRLQIICDTGYIAIESEPRECHENATWGNLDICVEISCGPVSYGTSEGDQWIAVNGKTSIRVLTCENGYFIEGSPAVTQCLPNGSWSYTNAVCREFPMNDGWSNEWTPSTLFMSAVAVGAGTAICIVCLFLSFLVAKKRRQSKTNTAVFHVGVRDSFMYTEGAKDQQSFKSTYEDVIELRHNSFTANPRKPSIALPHLPIDADPVYAQPFETSEIGKAATVNVTDIYTAHIYSEPVDSHKPLGVNLYNNVAETWLKSGAKKFGRKMSLPGRSSSTEDSMLAASPNNIAVCKPVFHSANVNPVNAIFENYEKTDFEIEKQDKLELISNSIYSGANDGSCSSCKDTEHLQMIDNDIYQGDYFSNV